MTTILVVDDSLVDRRLVGGLLEKDGSWTIIYAANGAEALAGMKQSPPDLVVTDLMMPEINGLELVTAARLFHPAVPVVLITAHGTEALALEALERGAASYVPKSRLAESLGDTIQRVLALSRADRSHKRLIECLGETRLSFCLENDPALVEALVDLIQVVLTGMAICDTAGRVRVGIALEESLLNALYRGNLEIAGGQRLPDRNDRLHGKPGDLAEQRRKEPPYCQRRIHVEVQVTTAEARFVVRDEGPGFDTRLIPRPDDATALAAEGNRGLILMQHFMDSVSFNAQGNEVTMIKRKE
jgi:CheY-like chemotaxis protein